MKKQCTRREFLKMAGLSTAAVGILVYLKSPSSGHAGQGIKCSKCNAVFNQGHKYKQGPVSGVYCPNCGIEISRLEYDVEYGSRFEYPRKKTRSKNKVSSWECEQVPFPNSALVQETGKPAINLSEIRI